MLSDEDTFTLLSDNLATENTSETFETPCEVPFCSVSMKLGHWQKYKQIKTKGGNDQGNNSILIAHFLALQYCAIFLFLLFWMTETDSTCCVEKAGLNLSLSA